MQKPANCPLDSEVSCGLVSAVRTLNDEVMRLNQAMMKVEKSFSGSKAAHVRDISISAAAIFICVACGFWLVRFMGGA